MGAEGARAISSSCPRGQAEIWVLSRPSPLLQPQPGLALDRMATSQNLGTLPEGCPAHTKAHKGRRPPPQRAGSWSWGLSLWDGVPCESTIRQGGLAPRPPFPVAPSSAKARCPWPSPTCHRGPEICRPDLQWGMGEVMRTQFLKQVLGLSGPVARAASFRGLALYHTQPCVWHLSSLLLGAPAWMPGMAEWEEASGENKMETGKIHPLPPSMHLIFLLMSLCVAPPTSAPTAASPPISQGRGLSCCLSPTPRSCS